jgi:hypothetical protein
LSHDEGKVFRKGVEDHEKSDPEGVPEKKEGGEEESEPVGDLGAAGLQQERMQVFRRLFLKLLLGKSPAPQERSPVGQVPHPSLDPEEILVEGSLFFTPPPFEEPAVGVETVEGNSNEAIYHSHVDDEPGDKIHENRPGCGKVNETHELLPLPPERFHLSSLPTNLPPQENPNAGKREDADKKQKRNGKKGGCEKAEIPDAPEHPVKLSCVEAVQSPRLEKPGPIPPP